MKLSLITVYVNNMEKSLKFYNEILGIPITRRQPVGGGKELIFLGDKGQVNLELIPTDERMTYGGFSIGFEVESLKEIKSRLADNGYKTAKEMQVPSGSTLCFLDGPNGEVIELIEN